MSSTTTIADMTDAELSDEYKKWTYRVEVARHPFSLGLAISMVELIEREIEKRAEPLDPMAGVEFPFADNH